MDLKLKNARGLGLALAAYSLFAGGVWVWRDGATAALIAGAAHLLIAVGLVTQCYPRSPTFGRRCAPWILLLPWVLWLLAWSEIGWLYAVAPPQFHDGAICGLDLAIFSTHLNLSLPQLWDGALWREIMTAIYLSYYLLIIGPPLWLAVAGRRDAYWRHTSGLILTYLGAFAIYLVWPVQGPRDAALLANSAGGMEAVGVLPKIMEALFRTGDSTGTAFPSSHCAGAVAAALLSRGHFRPRTSRLMALWAGLIVVATIHTNNHYAIDSLAGCVLALLIYAKEARHAEDSGYWCHRFHRPSSRIPSPQRGPQAPRAGAGST